MNRSNGLAKWAVVLLAVQGLLIGVQAIEAQTHLNSECITLLNPATCRAAGNSVCNYLAGVEGGGQCKGECIYCDSTNSIPQKSCITVENKLCWDNDKSSGNCGTSNQKKGKCHLGTTCICLNVSTVGPCPTEAIESCY